ncbi:MAG: amidohydrolase family protein, partial [bacterium]
MKLDLIIRNGNVVDGTGAAARRADVGVAADQITAIGDLSDATGTREIDASGSVVAPGFIDAHTHSDAYLLLEPDAPSKLAQGVTTEINGQCGGSAAPRLGQTRLSSDWASQTYPFHTSRGVEMNPRPGPTWTTVANYRELFDAVRPAVNTVQFIGHNTLRAGVMGYVPQVAAPEQVKAMQRLLEQALDEGGWGLSTGLLYQPGKYAAAEEVTQLARTAAAQGGMYATHMRSEGDQLLESVSEVLTLSREAGIHVQISHLKTSGQANWLKIDALLDRLNQARADGVNVQADRYPYTAACTDLDVVLPDWASAGGREAILSNLRNAETRKRVEAALDKEGRDWSGVMVGGGWSDGVRAFSGRTVAVAAAELGLTPGETVCRFIDLDDARTSAFFFGMCEANVWRIYAQPWVMPGSDASSPRSQRSMTRCMAEPSASARARPGGAPGPPLRTSSSTCSRPLGLVARAGRRASASSASRAESQAPRAATMVAASGAAWG